MRAYAQTGPYHTILESRVCLPMEPYGTICCQPISNSSEDSPLRSELKQIQIFQRPFNPFWDFLKLAIN